MKLVEIVVYALYGISVILWVLLLYGYFHLPKPLAIASAVVFGPASVMLALVVGAKLWESKSD